MVASRMKKPVRCNAEIVAADLELVDGLSRECQSPSSQIEAFGCRALVTKAPLQFDGGKRATTRVAGPERYFNRATCGGV